MNNQQNTEIKTLVEVLFSKFGKLTLNTDELSGVTGRSVISLKRDRAEAVGIPSTRLGKKNGSDRALYNIYDVAKFLVSRKIQVHENV